MHWFSRLFRRRKLDAQLDAELRFHIEQQTAENIAAGLPPAEARRRALAQFGGLEYIKEETRHARGVFWLQDFFQDLRFGLRMLRKSPGFTAVAVLTLALGIGANTAIFSAVNGILLEPLPYKDPSRLVKIRREQVAYYISSTQFREIRQCTSLEDIASYKWSSTQVTEGAAPEQVFADEVSSNFFALLGVKPLLGRPILPEDVQPGNDRVAVLNYRLWKSEFGGDPHIVGRSFSVDHQLFTIIGVMPQEFGAGIDWSYERFGELNQGIWVPLVVSLHSTQNSVSPNFIARLKKGATLEEANAQLQVLSVRFAAAYPPGTEGLSLSAQSLMLGIQPYISTGLWILMGAAGFVLLMACVNVTSLLVARSWTRQRELAIREALGASRLRILRQLSTENLLLALAGGSTGLFFSQWSIYLLRALAPPYTPRVDRIHLDGTVLWLTMGISLLAAILVGLIPALQASSHRPGATPVCGLSGSLAGMTTGRSHRLRSVGVVLEVVIAVIVLAGGALVGRSFYKLMSLDTGIDAEHVITMKVNLSSSACGGNKPQECTLDIERIYDAVRSIPGIQLAAISDSGLFHGGNTIGHYPGSGKSGLYVAGLPGDRLPRNDWIEGRSVTPSFFAALGIRLRKGRDFEPQDLGGSSAVTGNPDSPNRTEPESGHGADSSKSKSSWPRRENYKLPSRDFTSSHVAIVSESFAREFIPGDPLGRFISTDEDSNGHRDWMRIIGVANNVRDHALGQEPPEPVYYLPIGSRCSYCEIVARTSVDPGSVVSAMERVVHSVDKNVPITRIETVEQIIAQSSATPRFQTVLLGSFAALGLILAMIGIYGVISYSVVQRTHEIGVRMALGAERGDVLRMILGEGLLLAFIGIAMGVGGALALTRFLRSMLFEIKPTDPATFIGVAILLALVALAACYVPARRAMKVDPLVALRYE